MNNATLNALDGILLSGSSSNIVTGNVAIQDASECTSSLSCSAAAGIELFESSVNVVYSNTLTNNTTPSGTGAGIYLNFGSGDNAVFLNNATLNDVGISITTSSSNTIAKNSLYSNTYGILLSNAPNNTILDNNFGSNEQNQYPNQPTVTLTNIKNGTSISGQVDITWVTSGQAILTENLIIDGKTQFVSGNGFDFNSAVTRGWIASP